LLKYGHAYRRTLMNNAYGLVNECFFFILRVGLSKVYRRTKHIIGHIGDGFTGQMTQPTVSKHRRKIGS